MTATKAPRQRARPGRKRLIVMLGLCGLGVAAVTIDRLFLLPASAGAATPAAAAAEPPAELEAPRIEDLSPLPGPPESAGLRGALDRLAASRALEPASIPASLFRAPAREARPEPPVGDEPGGTAQTPWPDIRLSAVVLSDTGAAAVLNGRVVPVGGEILGATLEDVRPSHVVLRFAGAVRRLNLPRPEWVEAANGLPWSEQPDR